jgi:hypothetical protein
LGQVEDILGLITGKQKMIETQDESITIDVTAVNHEKYYISESPVV